MSDNDRSTYDSRAGDLAVKISNIMQAIANFKTTGFAKSVAHLVG